MSSILLSVFASAARATDPLAARASAVMRRTGLVILAGAAASCGDPPGQESIVEAYASFQRGEFAQALRFYDQALELDPRSAQALEGRGVTLVRLDRLDEALAAFDRVLELLPDAGPAHFNRGSVLSKLSLRFEGEAATRRLRESLAEFERAAELQPEDAETHFRVGLMRGRLGLPGDVAAYDRALELQPDHVEAHLYRGMALQVESPQEALDEFDRALEIEPDNPHAHYWRGLVLYGLERLDEAAIALDRAFQLGADGLYPGVARSVRESVRNGVGPNGVVPGDPR